MFGYQNRFSYPQAGTSSLRLDFSFAEKFFAYDTGLATPEHGFVIDTSRSIFVDIYRKSVNATENARFNIANYNEIGRVWNRVVPSLYKYELRGFVKVGRYEGSDIVVSDDKTTAYVEFPLTSGEYLKPGTYMDVWNIPIEGGWYIGPIEKFFRIHRRMYAATSQQPSIFMFDLNVYPSQIPAWNKGFPIFVGVLPHVAAFSDPIELSYFRTMLSSAWCQIVEGFRVEDEEGVVIDPPERYFPIDVEFKNQFFNWFYSSWNNMELPAGKYRFRFRINFTSGPNGVGTLGELGYYDDYWKEILIAFKKTSAMPKYPTIPFDLKSSMPPLNPIFGGALNLDSANGTFSSSFSTAFGMIDEYETRETVPTTTSFANNAAQTIGIFSQEKIGTALTTMNLNFPVDEGFMPLVMAEGVYLRPSIPLNGNGTLGDYTIRGKVLNLTSATPDQLLVIAGKWTQIPQGAIKRTTSLLSALTLYLGDYYLKLPNAPNRSFISIFTADGCVLSNKWTIVTSSSVLTAISAVSAIKIAAADIGSFTDWIACYYSYGAQTQALSPKNIKSVVSQDGSSTILLSNYMTNTFPIMAIHGTSLLLPGVSYTESISSGPNPGKIVLTSAPTEPVIVWYN